MNLLIFPSDFLASPKKPVYSCIFKLLAGKARFGEHDCKYDKKTTTTTKPQKLILTFYFLSILSLVGFWHCSPLSNFVRKLTRSVVTLYKWSNIAKASFCIKIRKKKRCQVESQIIINWYCANEAKLECLVLLLLYSYTITGTQVLCLNWSLQPVICKLDMSRQTLRQLAIVPKVSKVCRDERRTS